LNDNDIICDVGQGCKKKEQIKESLKLIKISIFLIVSSQEIYHTRDIVG